MTDIYTVGHSNRTINQFIKILIVNKITFVVDVRNYPGSGYVPQFNRLNLQKKLAKYNIKYQHIPELGGRRKNVSHIDTSIKAKTYASYAQYMRTPAFQIGLNELEEIATEYKTAIMCAEAVWWRCHRRMISDMLTSKGWKVYHLGLKKKTVIHQIWEIARVNELGQLVYDQ